MQTQPLLPSSSTPPKAPMDKRKTIIIVFAVLLLIGILLLILWGVGVIGSSKSSSSASPTTQDVVNVESANNPSTTLGPSTTLAAITVPASISGLVIWLDAVNGVISSSSGSLTWSDGSGNGYNATSLTTSGTLPSLNQSGINNLSCIQFYGGASASTTNPPSAMMAPVPTGAFSGGVTLFVVFQVSNDSSGFTTLVSRTVSNLPAPWDMYNANAFIGDSNLTAYLLGQISTSLVNISSPSIMVMTITNTPTTPLMSMWINGTSVLTLTNSDTSSNNLSSYYADLATELYLGTRGDNTTTFVGLMGEVIAYNSVLSTTNLNTVQSYLASKWGISAATLS